MLLPTQRFIYKGKGIEEHLNGGIYAAIDKGEHWIKKFGYVA